MYACVRVRLSVRVLCRPTASLTCRRVTLLAWMYCVQTCVANNRRLLEQHAQLEEREFAAALQDSTEKGTHFVPAPVFLETVSAHRRTALADFAAVRAHWFALYHSQTEPCWVHMVWAFSPGYVCALRSPRRFCAT